MNVSGVLVIAPAAEFDAVVERLDTLQGVEVHHKHRETGRIVVTIEAGSTHEEVEILRRVKALPDVLMAEMVYHHFEEDREVLTSLPPELDEDEGLDPVPPMLRD